MAPVAGAEAAPGSARDDNERVTSSTDRASDIEAQVAPDFHSEGTPAFYLASAQPLLPCAAACDLYACLSLARRLLILGWARVPRPNRPNPPVLPALPPGGSDAKGQLEEACAMPRECRICLGSDDAADLAAPCGCSGSCRYAHMRCLLAWCQERRKVCCELCGQPYREPYLSKLKAAVQAAAAADALPGVEQGGAGAGGMRAPGRSSALEGQGLDGLIDIQYFASQQELQAHVRGQWRQFGCQATLLIALLLGML